MTKRVLVIAGVAIVVAALAAYVLAPSDDGGNALSQDQMAAEIGAPIMEHLHRGHVPGRSGEIMLVPKPNNYLLGEWDLRTLGTDTPTLSSSHPNPWDYLTRVPIIASGGGIEPGQSNEDVTDIAALAPTYAEVLDMGDIDADAQSLAEVVQGVTERPKLIFTVVIDGGGWNVLREHPESWPFIQSLREDGITYTNATIGSAPSITGALHATFGTGVYPDRHGIPGNQMRGPEGNTDTWQQNADPTFLETPTVSELWDERNDNRPVVGTVSYEGWHLGMIGHGAQREGGDRDIAVLWEAVDLGTDEPVNEWWTNEDFYQLPSYLAETDLETLESYEEELDERDGLADDTWFGKSLEQIQDARTRPASPAFVRFTGDAVVDVIEREKLGRDELTDMFWVEMKMPDYAGHAFNMTGPEEADVLRETDRQLRRMKKVLDQRVGEGNYLFVLSADHGQQPLADTTGGWRINNKEIERDLVAEFGDGVLEKATPVDIYLDTGALADEDVEVDEVAEWLSTYTIADNLPDEAPGADRVPEGRLDETLFAGAFSSNFLQDLTPEEIESFGEGSYPEGRIYDPPSAGQ
ncbi:MAG: alkaline phosphatase family protein [Actinomycetota bacterium]